MRGSGFVSSTARALHRVFIAPAEQSRLQFLQQSIRPALLNQERLPTSFIYQQRCLSVKAPAVKSRLPRDHEIKDRFIQMVSTDGGLEEPIQTAKVMRYLDTKEETLMMVSEAKDGTPAICKIMNKRALYQAKRLKQKAQKNSGPAPTKTIELNWAIDPGDLSHRMSKMREFLREGCKVEVVFAAKAKRKKRQATEEEAESLLKKVRAVMDEVDGAKEAKPAEGAIKPKLEGKPLGTVTLFLQGKAQKKVVMDAKSVRNMASMARAEVEDVESADATEQVLKTTEP